MYIKNLEDQFHYRVGELTTSNMQFSMELLNVKTVCEGWAFLSIEQLSECTKAILVES